MKTVNQKQWTVATDITKLQEKTATEQWGVVYAIEYGEHLKIGFTKDIIQRVNNFLQQTKYNKVQIKKIAYTPYHSNYTENENLLHKLFKEFRKKGTELFDISLTDFLEKVPELEFDKTILDYQNEIKDLAKFAGQQKKEIISNTEVIPINEDITLPVREYNGQRVVTFKDIDFVHNRPKGTARRNFNQNKKRFIENIDFFTIELTADEIRTQSKVELTIDEIRRQFGAGKNAGRELILITKMGYLMLVKSFTDDKAWIIQRMLVVKYFDSMQNEATQIGVVVTKLIERRDSFNMEDINNLLDGKKINNISEKSFTLEDLKKIPIWVDWKLEERDGNKTKVPYNPQTGGKAMSNNPDTWATFDFAQSKSADYSGIGFMFADGICGIDIDNKTGNPELDKQAETIINLMDTYTERSPSGTGWHIIFRCDMSKIPTVDGKLDSRYYYKNPHNDLECYFPGLTNRYFTYTGHGNDKNIEDRTEQILIFIENYMLKDNFKKKKEAEPPKNPQFSNKSNIDDILNKARKSKNGIKFSALYDRGDISDYNNDDSSADLALCNMLAWWLQGDFNEIDHYFRQSALYREKWERSDYRTNTINKAIDNCNGSYYTPPGRPKTKKEKVKKEFSPEEQDTLEKVIEQFGVYDDEKLTISAVSLYLEQNNISVKYNETIREAEIKGLYKYNNNYIIDNFPVLLYNDLNLQYKKCNISTVQDFLRVIMMNNAYSPVLELINSAKWDNIDRLPELYRIMRIDDDDKLSKTLIYKWIWQNLSLARNDKGEYGADGLLVLKGSQAAGKTTFARKMALKNEWFGEGLLLDVRQTDTVIRAVSCWIGELGEIESTFKSDINALKAFITLSKDNYRVPYGRIADKLPRRTSFIGTCNSDEYLIDETGNRRYWTVPINERMDLEALEKLDALQLYLQIDEEAKNNIQGFRLTPEEITQLSERNGHHEKSLKGEQEIKDILFKAERDNLIYEEMTVTEFKELYPVLRNYAGEQIGRALKKLGIIAELKRKDGKPQKIANLPRPKYRLDIKDFN